MIESSGAGKTVSGSPKFPNFFTGRSKHFAWVVAEAFKSHLPAIGWKLPQTAWPDTTETNVSARISICETRLVNIDSLQRG